MITADPHDPRHATHHQTVVTAVHLDLKLFIATDPDGKAAFWALGDDSQAGGCACPDCAPHDQVAS